MEGIYSLIDQLTTSLNTRHQMLQECNSKEAAL